MSPIRNLLYVCMGGHGSWKIRRTRDSSGLQLDSKRFTIGNTARANETLFAFGNDGMGEQRWRICQRIRVPPISSKIV